jgi:hypothetical protein
VDGALGPSLDNHVVLEAGIPRTRYRRIGAFSEAPRAPIIDTARKAVLIYFPLSPNLAYLVGAAFGDGSISQRRLSYFNSDLEWLGKIANELRRLTDSSRQRPLVLPTRSKGVSALYYSNCALARLIGGSESARVNASRFLTQNLIVLAAFVAGFYDCEGSATIYTNKAHPKGAVEISMANANTEILQILLIRLGKAGIRGGISLSASPRQSTIEGRKVTGKKPVYRLRFSGWSSAVEFAKFILPWVRSRSKTARLEHVVRR